MSHYLLYFCVIYQLINSMHAKPLIGENVRTAMPNEFPFIASIGRTYRMPIASRHHLCSGSLITRRHVLTAAHCLVNIAECNVDVIIGEEDLRIARFRYEVDYWITYNSWADIMNKSKEFRKNDIAIITLTADVNRPGIRPVTLTPLNNERLYRKSAMIAGWGNTNEVEEQSTNVLRTAKVKILTPEKCGNQVKMITNKHFNSGRNYLCSSADPYVLTSCGDSGGPLVDENMLLLGISRSTCPNISYQWGDFSLEFINQYKVNRHSSVDYYRGFIEDVTNLVTRPRENSSFQVPLDL